MLSTPLTVCLVVMGKYIPQLEFLSALLGDKPVLEPKVCFYQRLLAMDQQEAGAVLEEYLKEKPLVDACDTILIPALGLAEQDRHRGVLDENREKFALENVEEMIERAKSPLHSSKRWSAPTLELRDEGPWVRIRGCQYGTVVATEEKRNGKSFTDRRTNTSPRAHCVRRSPAQGSGLG